MSRHALARQTQVLLDAFVLVGALYFAYLLRFDFQIPGEQLQYFLLRLSLVVLIQFGALLLAGIYSFIWRYIGLAEVQAFLRAALFSFTPLLLLRIGLPVSLQQWRIPLSVLLIDTVLAFAGVLSIRVLRRVLYEQEELKKLTLRQGSSGQKSVLLIGAGQAGVTVARELRRRGDLGIKALGFVDDDPVKLNSVLHGLRVRGATRDIPRLVAELKVDHLILSIVDASRPEIRRILDICEQVPVRVRVIPGLYEVIDGQVEISRIRDVEIEDLLGREPVQLETETLERFLTDRRVLLTGAGGSIGSELARQVLRFNPSRLILVERSEHALFEIDRELRARDLATPVRPVLADVTDEARMRSLLESTRPHVVLHAAAFKHVPMMEFHPAEAIENNTLATATLGRLAGEAGCEAFVMISTDKAVRPTSVMGASKRVAEIAIQNLSRDYEQTRFLAVRFGNVLGSTGSVIPIFREQIAAGGPVTVTHPSVTRYFMTPSEAAQLVLQAGSIGENGELLILDMGEPVSITNLAKDMIQLSGLRPYEDIDIVYTGLRPGEKLYEELELKGEAIDRTRHPKIFVGKLNPYSPEKVEFALRRLFELAKNREHGAIRDFLGELLPESDLSADLSADVERSTGD